MKIRFKGFGEQGTVGRAEGGLNSAVAASPGELAKTIAAGLAATLLFCVGLYICISVLVIAFLAAVL